MTRITIGRTVALTAFVLASLTLAACGSDEQPTSTASNETAVASTDSDLVYTDLKARLADFDGFAADLPEDAKSDYEQLKADIDKAELADPEQAPAAYATVKDDIDLLHDKLTSLGDSVDSDATKAWNDVKNEFDQIDAP